MNIFAIMNRVGGSGKTATAVNLAGALARRRRVLVVDLDAKGHASIHLGVAPDRVTLDAHDVILGDVAINEAICVTSQAHLRLLPGGPGLSLVEPLLAEALDPAFMLRDALATLTDVDDVIIDCPPGFGMLAINGLVAAQRVIVPWQASYLSLDGLVQEVQAVTWVVQEFNPGLMLEGVLPTRLEANSPVAANVLRVVEGFVEPGLLLPPVPGDVAIAEAPCYGKPVHAHAPLSRGAVAYRELASRLAQKYPTGTTPSDDVLFHDLRAA